MRFFRGLKSSSCFHTLDNLWKDHLLSMDHLKGGIGLRGYGQKGPSQRIQKEGYELFVAMMSTFKAEVVERRLSMSRLRKMPSLCLDSVALRLAEPPRPARSRSLLKGRGPHELSKRNSRGKARGQGSAETTRARAGAKNTRSAAGQTRGQKPHRGHIPPLIKGGYDSPLKGGYGARVHRRLASHAA